MTSYAERYGLDAEADAWRERAARFAETVLAPRARDADRAGRLDDDVIPALGAAGLIGAALPPEIGGGGASALAAVAIA